MYEYTIEIETGRRADYLQVLCSYKWWEHVAGEILFRISLLPSETQKYACNKIELHLN